MKPESISRAEHAKLCMPAESRQAVARRLAIAKGHLESILRMLNDPAVCRRVYGIPHWNFGAREAYSL